ncbi:unnamed protein product [Prorocentrum cordatum]|uniref:Uncharacterized protein n=1 Tax=Prorocentrum cordatum TaxID=2364126 RepID=A0ABN9W1C5_9DINO|nr:unnamed protein product [Polarella glacialis]
MLAHYPAHYQGFQVWGRALALGHQDVGRCCPRRSGALRALQANVREPDCVLCGAPEGSNGHLYFECEAVQRQQDDEVEEPFPEERLVTRERLRGQAVDTGDGPSYEHLEFALPLAPPLPDQVPEELPEFEWGLEGQAWGQQLFVDGSGRHSSVVEVRGCGWSVVQISDELLPTKARWGGLLGLVQTVPRSERHASMRAIQLGRPPVHVLSDHRSFVQEDAVLADGTAFRYVGNFWADVFAKMGSASIMVSEVHVRACEIQLRDVREAMRYVAWAAERAVPLSVGGSAAVPQQVAKVAQVGMKVPELSIVAHDLKQLTNGASLQTLCCSPCEPPTVGARHVTETAGFAIWCAVCGAWSSESNRLSPKFRDPCRGPSKVPKTRWKEKDAVKQLRRGLHPNTRVALETGRWRWQWGPACSGSAPPEHVRGRAGSGFALSALPEGIVVAAGFLMVLYGVFVGQAFSLTRQGVLVERWLPVPAGSKGVRDPWLDRSLVV